MVQLIMLSLLRPPQPKHQRSHHSHHNPRNRAARERRRAASVRRLSTGLLQQCCCLRRGGARVCRRGRPRRPRLLGRAGREVVGFVADRDAVGLHVPGYGGGGEGGDAAVGLEREDLGGARGREGVVEDGGALGEAVC